MIIEDITLMKSIGKGAFGEVFLTSKQGCHEKFATKKIEKKFITQPKVKKYFDNELGILEKVHHPNIIKLIDHKETMNSHYLVFELCNGGGLSSCLSGYHKKYKKYFPQDIVQHLMRQIVAGLKYLHSKNILHRDLKLDNILVNFTSPEDKENYNMLNTTVKIIDFGFARYLDPNELAFSTLGSPINMDPIILKKLNKVENYNSMGYTQKADIWSLGTLCYEMLIGTPTFDANSMKELVEKVEIGNYSIPDDIKLSVEAVSFLNGMLQYNPKDRLTASQLGCHKFLVDNVSKFTPLDLKKFKKNIKGDTLEINTKLNESIWNLFDPKSRLQDIDSNLFDEKALKRENDENNKKKSLPPRTDNFLRPEPKKFSGPIDKSRKDEIIQRELERAFDILNNECIFIEPMFIPIIPGNDPSFTNPSIEISDDV